MGIPLVVAYGRAGTGKNTLGSFLARQYGAVEVALADPMKRFAAEVFGFTEKQLWGPSECRDVIDTGYTPSYSNLTSNIRWSQERFEDCLPEWVEEVLPPHADIEKAIKIFELWHMKCIARAGTAGLSPRYALQQLGTEGGRSLYRDIWVDAGLRTCRQILGGGYTYTNTGGLKGDGPRRPPNLVCVTDGRFPNEAVGFRMHNAEVWKITRPNGRDLGEAGQHSSEGDVDATPDHFFSAHITNDGTIQDLEAVAAHLTQATWGLK